MLPVTPVTKDSRQGYRGTRPETASEDTGLHTLWTEEPHERRVTDRYRPVRRRSETTDVVQTDH